MASARAIPFPGLTSFFRPVGVLFVWQWVPPTTSSAHCAKSGSFPWCSKASYNSQCLSVQLLGFRFSGKLLPFQVQVFSWQRVPCPIKARFAEFTVSWSSPDCCAGRLEIWMSQIAISSYFPLAAQTPLSIFWFQTPDQSFLLAPFVIGFLNLKFFLYSAGFDRSCFLSRSLACPLPRSSAAHPFIGWCTFPYTSSALLSFGGRPPRGAWCLCANWQWSLASPLPGCPSPQPSGSRPGCCFGRHSDTIPSSQVHSSATCSPIQPAWTFAQFLRWSFWVACLGLQPSFCRKKLDFARHFLQFIDVDASCLAGGLWWCAAALPLVQGCLKGRIGRGRERC